MEEGNGKLIEHRLTKLEECSKNMQEDLGSIKRQVDNHIPSKLEELDNKLDESILKGKVQFISILIALVLLLAGTIINLVVQRVL
jgi:hypothetical protein